MPDNIISYPNFYPQVPSAPQTVPLQIEDENNKTTELLQNDVFQKEDNNTDVVNPHMKIKNRANPHVVNPANAASTLNELSHQTLDDYKQALANQTPEVSIANLKETAKQTINSNVLKNIIQSYSDQNTEKAKSLFKENWLYLIFGALLISGVALCSNPFGLAKKISLAFKQTLRKPEKIAKYLKRVEKRINKPKILPYQKIDITTIKFEPKDIKEVLKNTCEIADGLSHNKNGLRPCLKVVTSDMRSFNKVNGQILRDDIESIDDDILKKIKRIQLDFKFKNPKDKYDLEVVSVEPKNNSSYKRGFKNWYYKFWG